MNFSAADPLAPISFNSTKFTDTGTAMVVLRANKYRHFPLRCWFSKILKGKTKLNRFSCDAADRVFFIPRTWDIVA